MSHDDYESERYRVERVLEILEHAVGRLETRAYIPLSLLRDAVTFLRATEDAAYEAAQGGEEEPALFACIEQHVAARAPLNAMQEALTALERGDASAASRLAGAARQYTQLRREHMRVDDRLFASNLSRPRRAHGSAPEEPVESPATRQIYDRLVEASGILDIGAPPAFPGKTRTRPLGAK
jgi:hemerythrin-like domain-containing protein